MIKKRELPETMQLYCLADNGLRKLVKQPLVQIETFIKLREARNKGLRMVMLEFFPGKGDATV